MLVRQILSMKPSSEIHTVPPTARVAEAARMLAERRIGALVVSGDGRTAEGIISERDIVRELGLRGAGVLEQPVGEIMTRKLATCTTGETSRAILERMTEGRFRHLPVVDESGAMVGFISIGDAISARLKELAADKEALTGMIMGG